MFWFFGVVGVSMLNVALGVQSVASMKQPPILLVFWSMILFIGPLQKFTEWSRERFQSEIMQQYCTLQAQRVGFSVTSFMLIMFLVSKSFYASVFMAFVVSYYIHRIVMIEIERHKSFNDFSKSDEMNSAEVGKILKMIGINP